MTAKAIAKALRGRKAGAAWMARCPAHRDRTPSLAITAARDGTALVHCHAGCAQHDVIAALRALGLGITSRQPRERDRLPLRETNDDGAKRRAAQECAARWIAAGGEALCVEPLISGHLHDVWGEVVR